MATDPTFTPTTWTNGAAPGISAEQLNRIETGISDVVTEFAAHNGGTATTDHPEATTGARGFMSAADKSKLNGIEANAKDDQTITAGGGLSGGGTGNVTLSHADTSTVTAYSGGNGQAVQQLTFDTYGHVLTRAGVDFDVRYVRATGCEVYRASLASVADAAWTTIVTNAEHRDQQALHNPATGTITLPRAGIWLVFGVVRYAEYAALVGKELRIHIWDGSYGAAEKQETATNSRPIISTAGLRYYGAGTTLNLRAYQDSGAARNIAVNECKWGVAMIGENF